MELLFPAGKFLIPNYVQLQSFLTPGPGVLIKTTQHTKFAQQGREEKSSHPSWRPADEIV
jgi:hypothetical protein